VKYSKSKVSGGFKMKIPTKRYQTPQVDNNKQQKVVKKVENIILTLEINSVDTSFLDVENIKSPARHQRISIPEENLNEKFFEALIQSIQDLKEIWKLKNPH
jgi:hypothetical protein